MVYSANGLYAHKAQITTEMSHTAGEKQSLLYCQGYTYESNPTLDLTKGAHLERQKLTAESKVHYLVGELVIDPFRCDKLLVPNVSIRIKLLRSSPNFCLLSSEITKNFAVKMKSASLLVRNMTVSESSYKAITATLSSKNQARYVYPEITEKTFIIPQNQNQFIKENIFNNDPIRRLAIAMNTNTAFAGSLDTNPYFYKKFGLREVKIFRGGIPIVTQKTSSNVFPYFNTIKSLNFSSDGPNIPLSDYENHFIMVFDLTSTQEASTEIYYPELVGSNIRIELYFDKATEESVEVLFLGEKLTTILIDNQGKVLKDG